ncbi:MAG TPA: aminoglycoside phosphotransferase [Streptosporangiaceae bacterium]|nr:aminoglycoside phosphotransferase [Streptosporangiaceae bacterium]
MLDRDVGLLGMLARWLPQQRWFPGRGMALSELAIVSDVLLRAGDPAMRHLIVQAPLGPGHTARFQVLVGYRTALPAELGGALIGHQDGVACYDALHDPELADVLLAGMSEQRLAGQLRFVREPGAPVLAGQVPDGRVLGAEQSNTSLVFGDKAILKVLRRLFPGANPDLEVADALARLGSPRVAAPYGWIETDLDGEPVLLGVLSRFLAGASDGWTLALDHLRRLYERHGGYGREYLTEPVAADGEPGRALPFTRDARQLGLATAELHADLARAFGRRDMTGAELLALAADMHGKLSVAIAVVPDLAGHEERIRSAYDAVARLTGPVSVQRIHGDYHLGQVLLGPQGWVALDFEGEPAVPLAVRRAPAPALRDVAGMLRSFDYAARQQLVGHPDASRLAAVADAWAQQCQAAFRAGYAAGGGIDPAGHDTLLRALTLEKAVYEVVYEHRHRPAWLSIPLDFVAAA